MSELPASNEQLSRLARSDQYLGKDRDQLREIILDRDEEIAQLSDALQDAREVNYESEVAGLVAENKRLQGAFKNFHRLLCERFGCAHDEKDWERDQLSLIEWIAKRYSRDETTAKHQGWCASINPDPCNCGIATKGASAWCPHYDLPIVNQPGCPDCAYEKTTGQWDPRAAAVKQDPHCATCKCFSEEPSPEQPKVCPIHGRDPDTSKCCWRGVYGA